MRGCSFRNSSDFRQLPGGLRNRLPLASPPPGKELWGQTEFFEFLAHSSVGREYFRQGNFFLQPNKSIQDMIQRMLHHPFLSPSPGQAEEKYGGTPVFNDVRADPREARLLGDPPGNLLVTLHLFSIFPKEPAQVGEFLPCYPTVSGAGRGADRERWPAERRAFPPSLPPRTKTRTVRG